MGALRCPTHVDVFLYVSTPRFNVFDIGRRGQGDRGDIIGAHMPADMGRDGGLRTANVRHDRLLFIWALSCSSESRSLPSSVVSSFSVDSPKPLKPEWKVVNLLRPCGICMDLDRPSSLLEALAYRESPFRRIGRPHGPAMGKLGVNGISCDGDREDEEPVLDDCLAKMYERSEGEAWSSSAPSECTRSESVDVHAEGDLSGMRTFGKTSLEGVEVARLCGAVAMSCVLLAVVLLLLL